MINLKGILISSLVLPLMLTACVVDSNQVVELPELLFVVHKDVEGGRDVMEALYQGRVVEKEGCIRLDLEDEGAMVVWPPGYSLIQRSDGHFVRDENGDEVGRIGDQFRFGGGFIPTLWDDGPVDNRFREEIMDRCPGSYWIVGDMLMPVGSQ